MPDLKQEIKQTKEFSSLQEKVLLNLLRTNDRLQIQMTRLLRPYKLSQPQYNILRILRGANTPLPCLEIADRMIAVVPAITGVLDKLERSGLVVRERSTQDRRVINVSITARGLAMLNELDSKVRAMDLEILSHMSERELKQLDRLLERARERCT